MKLPELSIKQMYEASEKFQKKIIKAVLENCERELLLQILKKRGIIKKDWEQDRETYVMRDSAEGYPTIKEVEEHNV